MSSLIPHDYRYKISSPTPVDKEPVKINKKNTTQMVVFQNQNYLVLIPYFLLKRSIRPSA